jgi:hypothetical protein
MGTRGRIKVTDRSDQGAGGGAPSEAQCTREDSGRDVAEREGLFLAPNEHIFDGAQGGRDLVLCGRPEPW